MPRFLRLLGSKLGDEFVTFVRQEPIVEALTAHCDELTAARDEVLLGVEEDFVLAAEEQRPTALPKSPLGQAIGYALNNWEALHRYLDQGYLAIGRVERWRGSLVEV